MQNMPTLVQIALICALIVLAKMLIQSAPIVFIPLILLFLIWIRMKGRVHFHDDDPADWWKKGKDE